MSLINKIILLKYQLLFKTFLGGLVFLTDFEINLFAKQAVNLNVTGGYQKLYDKWFIPAVTNTSAVSIDIIKLVLIVFVFFLIVAGIFFIWYLKRVIAENAIVLKREIDERKLIEENLYKYQENWHTLIQLKTDALIEKERQYYDVYNATAEAIIILNKENWQLLEANKAFEEMFGYCCEDIPGLLFDCIICKPEQFKKFDDLNELSNYQMKRKGGGLFWAEVTFRQTLFKGKKHIIAVIRDISLRKAAEERLRKSEEQQKFILDSVDAGLVVVNYDNHEIMYVNTLAANMIEAPKEDIIGKRCFAFFCPEKVCPILDCGQLFDKSERLLYTAGDRQVPILKSVTTAEFEGEKCLVECFVDITDIKRVRERLREREQYLQSIIDTAQVIILLLDANGKIIHFNKYLEDISGYRLSDVKGSDWFETFLPQDRQADVREVFKKCLQDISVNGNIDLLVTKTGELRHIEWYDKPLKNNDGVTEGLLAIGLDVSAKMVTEKEKQELEEHLRQSQKMEAIGMMAGGIAHDFNNILCSILCSAELAEMFLTDFKKAKKHIEHILISTTRAKELVQQILTFSRKSTPEFKVIQLDSVIKETVKMLKSMIPKTIEIQLGELSEKAIVADLTGIHQIIMNLSTNAYHAMQDSGGILKFTLEEVVFAQDMRFMGLQVSYGNYLRMSVQDTGHGIDTKKLSKIFEPYFTTKSMGEGNGLGLATVHGLVRSFGGAIDVESGLDKGTHFKIYFPIVENICIDETCSVENDQKLELNGNEAIMLIDDDVAVCESLKIGLCQAGYQVRSYTDSLDAYTEFSHNPNKYDLIITDMTMPKMTGKQFSEKAIVTRMDIPIIMTSGYSEKVNRETALGMGVREFIEKPLSIHRLLQAVKTVFDEQRRII